MLFLADLLLQAKSGTGKTCVFSVISLESVDLPTEKIQVLVLCPSREIAYQSKYVIKSIGVFKSGESNSILKNHLVVPKHEFVSSHSPIELTLNIKVTMSNVSI